MTYNQFKIDQVINSNMTIKEKEDELLRMDSQMYCYMGSESTEEQRMAVAASSLKIYTAINEINPESGRLLLFNN
jgi:hypothetical protein|tara:strand:+ start:189 stop:413 length:225 start_codon:yes stop_codon:yes gene_type:complete